MLKGKQSWELANKPVILSTGVSGGPLEGEGPIGSYFDLLYDDNYVNEESHEKAQRKILEDAVEIAMRKGGLNKEDIQFFLAGDLVNQMTPTSFTARKYAIPHMGLYGACATSMEGLALGAFIVNYGGADHILCGASSHKGATDKQFRYPTDYGGQKPPTSQCTVTGAGVALIGKNEGKTGLPVIKAATIGKVVDLGLKDPFNMGGAMAPAAVSTIMAHHEDFGFGPNYYDAVITGDLGEIGRKAAYDLLSEKGFKIDQERLMDCGLMIYSKDQNVFAGGSGAACSATVLYGYLLELMKKGTYQRILFLSTGALLSPLSFQQGDTIPCIAHAVSIEFIQ